MSRKYRLFSLFTGAGGLDLGFKLTGKFEIMFGNDILGPAMETYARNFGTRLMTVQPNPSDLPAVFKGDVSTLDFNAFNEIQANVITGGPPCQDFSIVRGPQKERSGIEVARGKLYSYFIRALVHLQPETFVFENVPGLLSANKMEAYKLITEDFSSPSQRWKDIKKIVGNNSEIAPRDYEIIYSDVVNASRLGVPQARRRLILIGVRKDLVQRFWWNVTRIKKEISCALNGEDGRPVSKYPLTPLEVFEGKPLPDLQSKYEEIMEEYAEIAKQTSTHKASEWKKQIWLSLTFDVIKDYLSVNKIQPKNREEIDNAFADHVELLKELGYYNIRVADLKSPDGSNDIPNESAEVLERMRQIPPDENYEFVRGTTWEVEGRGMSLIYRRTHPLKPAYTVVAYGGGGTWGYHYERQRGMFTNRERARLQTFPDDFVFKGSLSSVRAQIGEAVPPLLGKRIAQAILKILESFS
ncbi:MAG: DNA cytosine methyltransferase [Candidatus Bathyarchaeia archaeon]